MSLACGWCITDRHDQCKPAGEYEGKTWTCECADRKHQPREKENA